MHFWVYILKPQKVVTLKSGSVFCELSSKSSELYVSKFNDLRVQKFKDQRSWRSISYRSKIMEIKISQIKDHADQEFNNQRSISNWCSSTLLFVYWTLQKPFETDRCFCLTRRSKVHISKIMKIKSSHIKDHGDQFFTDQRSWRSRFHKSKIMEIKSSQIKDHADQEFVEIKINLILVRRKPSLNWQHMW